MKFKRFLSIPVSAVFLLAGFVYYITVFVFVEDWIGLRSSAGSLNAMMFTLLCFLCLFSFFACVLIDPGQIPASYVPDVEESRRSDEEPHKNGAQLRHCDRCSTYKPPRAHHCRVCRRCVLRMDHHCLWINNCVGYWNYKPFFILVLYATIGSIYSTFTVIISSFQKDFSGRAPLKVFYVICGAVMIALSATLGTLLVWHIYLIIHNMTTIEYYEGIRASWLARKSGQSYQHPFNLSVYRNITSVLGPNMLKWWCPTALGHLKDGLTFPVSRDGS
ncbi:probable protein S-acyltransferase 15 isoform X2 [Juglans microcarpa x Juglans regia]|uniref:probable protein S-acyltransferase 15 isoform X2 n=1 Tax=Juglans microcarpa x Juglans regia TaxID=2249226 RepID=UPI001B7F0F05|nr:probable protein S-acyltransferase 15 isoform X2 [Juglans microcarpa x Juglans regia]